MHVCASKALCVTTIPHSHVMIESASYWVTVMPWESSRTSNSDAVGRLVECVRAWTGAGTAGTLSVLTSVMYVFSRHEFIDAITINKHTKQCKWSFKWPWLAWALPAKQNSNILWWMRNKWWDVFTKLYNEKYIGDKFLMHFASRSCTSTVVNLGMCFTIQRIQDHWSLQVSG